MWHEIWRAAFAFALQPAFSAVFTATFTLVGGRTGFLQWWLYCGIGGVITGAIDRDWPWAIGSVASLLVALAIRWWRSSKRRKAAALLGAKARALRDSLVRRAREAAQPRPVLRPSLKGI